MQQELNYTVQTLLGSRSLEDVPREQLEGLVLEFPYASPLQLLYSKKLQLLKDPGYADQVSRTALYFNNPHWLNFQLWNRESNGLWIDEESRLEQPVAEMDHAAHAGETTGAGLVSVAPVAEQAQNESIQAEPLPAQPLKPWHVPSVRALQTEGVSLNPENFPADQEDLPLAQAPAEEPLDFPQTQAPATEPLDFPQTQAPATEPLDFPQTPAPAESPVVLQPASLTPEPGVEMEPEPLIPLEPYYTIDYFASQGIQLTDAESQDNLGRKLKSFTDWLKTMKKVHSEKREPSIDAFAEARIKEGAERSNDLKEVWTEAMAEVYLKQGLKHKALEVYQKLSLQNPAQSANFAAKIAELND